MTFKFDITDAEFSEYVSSIYRKSWSFSGNGWKYATFILALIGINIYTSMSKIEDSAPASAYVAPLLSWLIFVVILGIAWFVIVKLIPRNSANGAHSTSKTWIYALVCVGSLIGYCYFSGNASGENGEGDLPTYASSLLNWVFLVGIICSAWFYVSSRLTSAKRLKPEDRETLLGDREMTFDEDKLTTKNHHTESIFRWEAIKKWEQSTNLYLLFITANSAFIVPKRIFENVEQQAEFEQLIKRKLPNLTSEKYLDA